LILKIGQTGKTGLPRIEIPDVDVKNFFSSMKSWRNTTFENEAAFEEA
jgi:hypothetical protein